MVTKEQKKKMLDYLVDKLEQGEGKIVKPISKNIIGNIKTNIITLEKDVERQIVLLLDQTYTQENFERLKQILNPNCYVFYKDGKTFFRNAGKKIHTVGKDDRSLKNYTNEQILRMIAFRPEEIAVHKIRRDELQYYQPKSEELEEALVTYKFDPVTFDYNHINRRERFRPYNTDSKRIYIWSPKTRKVVNEPLLLAEKLLEPRSS